MAPVAVPIPGQCSGPNASSEGELFLSAAGQFCGSCMGCMHAQDNPEAAARAASMRRTVRRTTLRQVHARMHAQDNN